MKKPPISAARVDPWPYDGPIRSANGTAPYNHHLWPTESWWLGREISHCFDGRWHFGYVHLADGRFCIDGDLWHIEKDDSDPANFDKNRVKRKNNFTDRRRCIRAAAARLILILRGSRRWNGLGGGLNGRHLATAINWVLHTVARETGGTFRRPVIIREKLPPAKTLFEVTRRRRLIHRQPNGDSFCLHGQPQPHQDEPYFRHPEYHVCKKCHRYWHPAWATTNHPL